ncbi:antibiotic biosynthesis monooxygenase [Rhodococcus erythropolis]
MLIVIARLEPQPDRRDELIEVYTDLIPEIHEENGCELFSLHANRREVVIVER